MMQPKLKRVGEFMLIDWCRYCNDEKIALLEIIGIRCECDVASVESLLVEFVARVDMVVHHSNSFGLYIKANDIYML